MRIVNMGEVARFSNKHGRELRAWSRALATAMADDEITFESYMHESRLYGNVVGTARRTYLCVLALGYGPKEHREILAKHIAIHRLAS